MADQVKDRYDIDFQPAPGKGKACHMQVDADLHAFLLAESQRRSVTFRKIANRLLCDAIQDYIKAKKIAGQVIRDRTD